MTNVTPLAAQASTITNDIRDIRPPVEIPNPWIWVMGIVAALLILGALLAAWLIWRKRRKEIAVPLPIPPEVTARQELERALGLIGDPKVFCTVVSDAIRRYLEARFSFHAPDRTTEEFLYELKKTDLLTFDQKQSLGEFLERCDLVKFAKYEPREPELRDLHQSAVRLVDETEPVAAPVPPANGAANVDEQTTHTT